MASHSQMPNDSMAFDADPNALFDPAAAASAFMQAFPGFPYPTFGTQQMQDTPRGAIASPMGFPTGPLQQFPFQAVAGQPLWPPPFPPFPTAPPFNFALPQPAMPQSFGPSSTDGQSTGATVGVTGSTSVEREEGELSDVEFVASNAGPIDVLHTGQQRVKSGGGQTLPSNPRSVASLRSPTFSLSVKTSFGQSSRPTGYKDDAASGHASGSSRDNPKNTKSPAHSGPPHLSRTMPKKPTTRRSQSSLSKPSANLQAPENPGGRPAEGMVSLEKNPSEVRGMALNAIRDMVSYDIDFNHYLSEGIDRETLAGLFHELGLPVPPLEDGQRSLLEGTKVSTATGYAVHGTASNGLSQGERHQPQMNGSNQSSLLGGKVVDTGREPLQTAADMRQPRSGGERSRQSSTPSTALTLPAQTAKQTHDQGPVSSLPKKIKPSESHVERKDLILAKLAAKGGITLAQRPATKTLSKAADLKTTPLDSQPITDQSERYGTTGLLDKMGQSASTADVRAVADTRLSAPPAVSNSAPSDCRRPSASPKDNCMMLPPGKATLPEHPYPSQGRFSAVSPSLGATAGVAALTGPSLAELPLLGRGAVQERKELPESSATVTTIPGLFMTVASASERVPVQLNQPLASNVPLQTRLASRKRPVAADFDSEPPPGDSPAKRPFGSFRTQQALVIEVSDDEDTGDEAAEDPAKLSDGEVLAGQSSQGLVQPVQKRISIRDMPPLPDFPPSNRTVRKHKDSGTRTSGAGTPVADGAVSRGKSLAQEDLKRREEEIRLMRKTIAEYELRKATLTKSRAQTPTRPSTVLSPAKVLTLQVTESDHRHSSRIGPSQQEDPVAEKRKKTAAAAAAAAAAESAKRRENKRLEQLKTEEKTRRRQEIESGLSQMTAEVEQENRRLEEIKAEREQREIAVQQALLRRQRLEQELLLLDVDDSQGTPQGGPSSLDTLAQDAERNGVSVSTASALSNVDTASQDAASQVMATTAQDTQQILTAPVDTPLGESKSLAVPLRLAINPEESTRAFENQDGALQTGLQTTDVSQTIHLPELMDVDEQQPRKSSIPGLTATLLEVDGETELKAVKPDEEPLALGGGAERLDHSIDDTEHVGAIYDHESNAHAEGRRLHVGNLDYAATAHDLAKLFKEFRVENIDIPVNPQTNRLAGYAFVTLHPQADSRAAMNMLSGRFCLSRQVSIELAKERRNSQTTSSVDETSRRHQSPVVTAATERTASAETDEALTTDGHEDGEVTSDSEASADSDAYEPPEDLPVFVPNNQTVASSPPFSAEADDSPPFSPKSVGSVGGSPREHFAQNLPLATMSALEAPEAPAVSLVDDLVGSAYRLQGRSNEEPQDRAGSSFRQRSGFTAYSSPLNRFHSYRYHPNYLQTVSQGFRSLTYSHRIDPMKPLCRFEAVGGICNDQSCDGQHFRNMEISDEIILFQLSSVKDDRSPGENAKFMSGLRHTLQELRSNKQTDFSTVAAEISRYRSTFLQDPSRVLVLNSQNESAGKTA